MLFMLMMAAMRSGEAKTTWACFKTVAFLTIPNPSPGLQPNLQNLSDTPLARSPDSPSAAATVCQLSPESWSVQHSHRAGTATAVVGPRGALNLELAFLLLHNRGRAMISNTRRVDRKIQPRRQSSEEHHPIRRSIQTDLNVCLNYIAKIY